MTTSKEQRLGQTLEVKVPTFFRCPISLDVMRSPVSLCTGVTYDRASIQRWLDSGNTTCPATMLPLPSTDLIPNLTLQRLIQIWSAAAAARRRRISGDLAGDLSRDPISALRDLADFLAAADVDDAEKASLVAAGAASIAGSLAGAGDLEVSEAAAGVFATVLDGKFVDEVAKTAVVAGLRSDIDGTLAAILRVLGGARPEPRAAAARVLAAIVAAGGVEEKAKVADKNCFIEELVRLVDSPATMEAGISCLAALSAAVKRSRPRMVAAGAVPAATRVLNSRSPAAAAELALKVMEGAASCAEGRAAMVAGDAAAVAAVVGRMVKVGREGAEAAVAALWSVCVRFPDRRAVEAVAASEGGAAKLLLLMQSGCSPAARQMAAEMLRVFRVNAKSCLPRYDTKTTHIMPF